MSQDNTEKSIRILTFSGKKEDWMMWSDKFMAKAIMKGYDEVLDGTIIVPDDKTTNPTPSQVEARKLNKLAYNELILACTDKIAFGIVKNAKTNDLKKGDAKIAWERLKTRYEPNTGTELLALNKEYMSMELEDVKTDPEDFITDLDELRTRMADDPFNEVITDKSFMLHVLNSLPTEYESIVETMERDLGAGILTIDDMKEQVRSKYRRLTKRMNIKEDELALSATNNKMKKKQGFKGNCRICGKYGHKAADCWENKNNKNKKPNQGGNRDWIFKGKCNFCGIYGHKERDCRKKKAQMEAEENKANLAKDIEEEETVLIATTENKFNDQVRRKLLLDNVQNETALICMAIDSDGIEDNESNESNRNNNDNRNEELIDLQSDEIQNIIDEQERNESIRDEMNEVEENQTIEEGAVAVPQDIIRELMNNNEEWRQSIISHINRTGHTGRNHRFLPLGSSQRPNPYEGNRLFYAQWDPNVSENQVREFLDENESSDEEITWGIRSDEDEEQRRRQEEKIFDLNDSDDENETALITKVMDATLFTKTEPKFDTFEKDTWIADSGASTHMCNSDEGMYQCVATPNQFIKVGNGDKLAILKKGMKRCTIIQKNGSKINITLHNVYHVPKLWYNLFSLMEALRHGWKLGNKGMNITITSKRKHIEFDRIFKCPTGHLNGVKIQTETDTSLISKEIKKIKMFQVDAHNKLMHTNAETVKLTADKLNWKLVNSDKYNCIPCAKGKAKQKKILKITESKGTRIGERLFIDISWVNVESYGGSRYWAIVVDDFSNFKWCVFMKRKSQLKNKIIPILKELNLRNQTVTKIRCDNAGENYKLKEACIDTKMNILFEFTAPNSPQYNGKVERAFATAYSKIRATLNYAGLTTLTKKRIWSECAATVIKIENILIKDKNKKCPYELMFGHMPNYIEDLRTFGEIAIVRDNGNKLKGKLSDRGLEAMFVGYSEHHAKNVYRFLNLKTNRIMTSRDVTWMHLLYKDYIKEKESDTREIVVDDYNANVKYLDNEISEAPKKIPRAIRELQTSYNDAEQIFKDTLNEEGIAFMGFALASESVTYPDEPTTFQDAWHHKDAQEREGWRKAIKKEFHDMMKRGVWRRIKRSEVPSDRRTIGSKWVFKRKRDGRYRARLCGLGYTQVAGVDFNANFAPVVNDVTFRLLLVIKMMNNWNAELIDIETAFLHGEMEELIFMDLPEGLNVIEGIDENNDDDCVILDKCIYGTVQSARQWAKKFKQTLKKLNFNVSLLDPCLMSRTDEHGMTILCIYVDDVLIIGNQEAIDETIKDIEKEFDIRKEGKLNDYLGCIIEFSDDNTSGTIHQPHILKKLEKKFVNHVKRIRKYETPSAPGSHLLRPKDNDLKLNNIEQAMYRSGIGMLLYLTKHTRPDIANAVREHSRMMDGATMEQYNSLLRIIKYVIDTKNHTLKLKIDRNDKNIFNIKGYSDSDYAGNKDDRKSITGLIVYCGGVPIAWKSKGQKAVSLSSTESEYYAMSELCSEIIYIKQLLEFLQIDINYPIIIRVDNVGAMFLANNPVLSQRTKHISVRHHFVREFIEDGILKIVFVKSKMNHADIFTKNLSRDLFEQHKKSIMSGTKIEEEDEDKEKN